jgi:molybdenum cofactor cytidylyltransferase
MTVAGILLAAGEGKRFGADKLMHPLPDGTPIAVQSARNLLKAMPGAVAVVRSSQSELAKRLAAEGLRVVECPDAAEGMGRTLSSGVRAARTATGWVVALADMPFVRPATISAVANALEQGAAIVSVVHDNRRGNPVGLSSRYFDELVALRGDRGARDILRRDADAIVQKQVDDPGVLRDIDTPQDL